MTDSQLHAFADAVINDLDAIGREKCSYEYGLPIYTAGAVASMKAAIRERLREILGVIELKAAE